MTNKTIELYTKDISRIKLPPISDRVCQAIREKKSKYSEEIKNNKNKVHSNFPMKYIWAAMLAMLVISVPIVIILSNQNTVLEQESSVQNSTEAVSKTGGEVSKSVGTNKTLEVIMKKKIFGEVALTKQPEEECEMYLMNYQHGNSVYEDDYYLYNFDSDGNLIIYDLSDYSMIAEYYHDDEFEGVPIAEIDEQVIQGIFRNLPHFRGCEFENVKFWDDDSNAKKWLLSY